MSLMLQLDKVVYLLYILVHVKKVFVFRIYFKDKLSYKYVHYSEGKNK